MFNNELSLILGIAAWIVACFSIASKEIKKSYLFSITSFSFCLVSLFFQFLEVKLNVDEGDIAAIIDTINAVVLAAGVLIGFTIVLNVISIFKVRDTRRND